MPPSHFHMPKGRHVPASNHWQAHDSRTNGRVALPARMRARGSRYGEWVAFPILIFGAGD